MWVWVVFLITKTGNYTRRIHVSCSNWTVSRVVGHTISSCWNHMSIKSISCNLSTNGAKFISCMIFETPSKVVEVIYQICSSVHSLILHALWIKEKFTIFNYTPVFSIKIILLAQNTLIWGKDTIYSCFYIACIFKIRFSITVLYKQSKFKTLILIISMFLCFWVIVWVTI